MALRSGYKGFKKLLPGLKLFRPGTLGIDNDVLIPELNKTFFPRSEQAVLGANNIWDESIALSSNASGTVTKTTDGYAVQTNTSANSGGQFNQTTLRTRYTPFGNITVSFEYKSDIACAGYIGKSDVTLATDWTKVSYSVDGSKMGAICFYNRDTTKTPLIEMRNMMITLATDTDPSFVPPAMTNKELTDLGLVYRGAIPSGASLDDYVELGMWDINGTNPTNLPTGSSGYVPIIVLPRWVRGNIKQIIISRGNEIYLRNKNDSESWSSWYKFTGTEVS